MGINSFLTQNENSLKFLTELGLSKPDIFAEIKEFIIPKYRHPNPDVSLDEYFEDFEKLLIAFKKEDSEKKKGMIEDLRKLYIIYSINSVTAENQFCKPVEVYLKSDDLVEYFQGYDHVFFVCDDIYKRLSNFSFLNDFLINIGCENKPRRISINPHLTSAEKEELRKNSFYNGFTREIYTHDYDYEGLDNFLKNITKEKSFLLWKFLLQNLASYDKWSKIDFFKGEYSWFYYKENIQKYDAKFLKTLKNAAWLVDKNGSFVLPSQISLSTLHSSYIKDDDNIDCLIKALNFQIDEIKQIEEKTGGKFVPKHEYEEFIRWKKEYLKEKSDKSLEDDSWNPELEPEKVEPAVEEIEPETLDTPDFRGQRPSQGNTVKNDDQSKTNDQDIVEIGRSKKELKDIGQWGERFVYNYLKKRFEKEINTQIIWLNENGDIGKGYDFLIVAHGEKIEYIEVKSKTDSEPQLFEITGTQWEFARKLYNENEGDKYKIYVVSNAGTKSAKIKIIKNPTKLWKDGKIYAHPVHLKL